MRRLATITLGILALVTLDAGSALAAEPVFLALKVQGADVHGDVALKGVEGMIECLSYEQEVTTPRDTASGMATGRRQYHPIRITKRIDQASEFGDRGLVIRLEEMLAAETDHLENLERLGR